MGDLPEELSDEFRGAFGPVLADLDRSSPGCVRLDHPQGDSAVLVDTRTGAGTGLWLPSVEGQTAAELVADSAVLIQDIAITDIIWGAWPECPDHAGGGRMLRPSARGEDAVWVCEEDDRVIAAIGELPAP